MCFKYFGLICGLPFSATDISLFVYELILQVPRVPMHALAMVVPPQEPDRAPQENPPALLSLPKG